MGKCPQPFSMCLGQLHMNICFPFIACTGNSISLQAHHPSRSGPGSECFQRPLPRKGAGCRRFVCIFLPSFLPFPLSPSLSRCKSSCLRCTDVAKSTLPYPSWPSHTIPTESRGIFSLPSPCTCIISITSFFHSYALTYV